MIATKKDEPSKHAGTKKSSSSDIVPEESDPRKRPQPGAGGISKEKYHEITEKAVEDIHG